MTWRRAAACVLAAAAAGSLAAAGEVPSMPMQRFTGSPPAAGMTFEYPYEWFAEVSSGAQEPYWQVQVYGPRTLEPRMRTYLVVRRLPAAADGGRHIDVPALEADFERTAMPGMTVASRTAARVAGQDARRLAVRGSLRLPWRAPDAQAIPVEGERLFFAAGRHLYEVGWLATPEASAAVSGAFAHLLATLRLHEDAPPAR